MARATRSVEPPRLHHPEQLRHRQLEIYYVVLAEEPGFEADFEGLNAICTARPLLLPAEAIARRLIQFCRHWRLPPATGVQDVLFTLFVAKPQLLRDYSIDVRNVIPCPRVVAEWPSVVDLARAISDSGPSTSPTRAMERAETELRAALSSHGFRPIPPRHHNETELRRMARRLVRRVVNETPWQQIADAEGDDTNQHAPDLRSVQTTVREWSRALDIPLPALSGGWPVRNQSRD